MTALARRRRPRLTRTFSIAATALAVLTLAGMAVLFAAQSLPVWQHAGLSYLTGTEWFYRDESFGVASMLYGTIAVACVAVGLAAPIGIGAAVATSELLPPHVRVAVKGAIELLAGIPSVVFGLLGVLFLRGFVYDGLDAGGFDPLSGDTLLTAGVLLAVMILPTVMTLSDDALRAVPDTQRKAARGLGLTRVEVVVRVVLPQAARGLVSAVLLALGRALGETIAVYLVVGRRDNQFPESLLTLRPIVEPGQTLSSKLGGSEASVAWGDPLHWGAIVGLAVVLLALVTTVTLVGTALARGGVRDAR